MRKILRELDLELAQDAPALEPTFVELSTVETWSELLRCEMRRDPASEIRQRLLEVAKIAITAVERIDQSDFEHHDEFSLRQTA